MLGPGVALVIVLADYRDATYSDNLRAGVMRTPATRLQHLLPGLPRRHPKIRHLDILILVQQQVFRLQVAMTNVEAMTIVDGVNDLLKVVQGFGFGETTALDEVVE